MPEKVEIIVELKNDQDVKKRLNDLQQLCNQLNRTVNVNVNSTALDRTYSKVISLQSAFNNLGGAFNTIGGALTGISNIFRADLLGTVERTLTAYGTILATQGFKSAISRYDIMTTYADYMEIMGVSADKADESLERVNQAIQGIPVGLDTAAQEIRMFTMYLQGTGDSMDEVADKATNLTIGLERALVAGGASEAMKTTAKYEIQRLLATGSLTTKRQWQALLNGLGVSGQYLKDVMGYGDMSTQDFISELTSGGISTDAFIQGVADLADYEGLNKAIDIYKETIEAGMYDIKFAVTRGFANTFQVINDMLESETGKGIRDYMQDIRQGVNELFFDIQGWIQNHPEVITMIFDKLNEIMERAKELNIGQVMSDIATQGGKMIDFFIRLYDAVPTGFWRNLIVFSTTWAGPLGRLFTGIGTIFTTLGKLVGYASKIPLIGRLFSIFTLGGATGTSIGGKSIAGTFAGIGSIAAFGGVIYEYAKIMESVGKMDFGNWKDNMDDVRLFLFEGSAIVAGLTTIGAEISYLGGTGYAAQGMLLAGGFEALIAGVGGLIFEFAKVAETVSGLDLANFDANMAKISNVMGWISTLVMGTTAIGGMVAAGTGGIGALFAAIGEVLTAGIIANIDLTIDAIKRCADMAEVVSDMTIADDVENKIERLGKMLVTLYETLPELTDEDINSSGYSSAFFDNMATAIENMKTAADNLANIEGSINWLNRREGKFNDIKTKVTEFASGIGDIYQAFVEGFGPSWLAKVGSKNYSETVGNMNTALEELKGMTTAMQQLEVQMNVINLGMSGVIEETEVDVGGGYTRTDKSYADDPYQQLVGKIREMVNGVTDIMDVLGKDAVTAVFKNWKTSTQRTILNNMKQAMSNIKDIATVISETEDGIADLLYRESGTQISAEPTSFGLSQMDIFVQQFTKFVGKLDSMFRSEEFLNLGSLVGTTDWAMNFTDMATVMRDGVQPIVEAIDASKDAISSIYLEDTTGELQTIFEHLNTAFNSFGEDDGSEALGKATNIANALEKVEDMVTSLSNVKEKLTGLFGDDNDVGKRIGELLTSMYGSLGTEDSVAFHNQALTLKTTVGEIQALFDALSQTDISKLNGQMETLCGHIDDVNKKLPDMKGYLDDSGSSARTLAANLQSVGVMAVMASGHIPTLSANLDTLVGRLSSAASAAGALASALGSIPGSVNVAVTGNVGRGERGLNRRVLMATGGPVGTDTIPAWLSPGEFVMRAKAVRTFGEVFMRNVNQLNIPGAVNALAKQYAFNNPTSNSYVNNYDNHASVNQTIITNNADYSYKRASRFVRALH